MKLPVFKALGASFAYVLTHGLDLLKALWLPQLLFTAAILYALPKYMGPMLAVMELGPNPDPAAAVAAMGSAIPWLGLILVAAFIFQPMSYVGAMRHVLRGEELRSPFYVGFGGDELRVAGTFILLMVMFVLVYIVGVLATLALTAALGAVAKGPAVAIIAIVPAALVAGMLWFSLRMSLSLPAAVAERRIGLPFSWRMTKGNSLALLLYFLIVLLIMAPVFVVYMLLAMPTYFADMNDVFTAAGDPAKVQEIQLRMTRAQIADMTPGSARFPLLAAGMYIYQIIMTALWTVPPAIAYRYLAGNKPGA